MKKSVHGKGKRLKSVITCGVIGVMLFSVLSMVASVMIFQGVFARREDDAYALKMAYTPGDEARYPRQGVEFTSGENRLQGYLYEGGEDLVILINGFRADQTSHLGEVFYLLDAGFSVLTYDGTGVGESQGDSIVGLEQHRLDGAAALDFATEFGAYEHIFLYGHSAGGYGAAALAGDPRVTAAVVIAGFNDPMEMMMYYAENYVGALAYVGSPFLTVYDRILFGDEGGVTAREQLEATEHPVLVVQGAGDQVVPMEMSIYQQCGDLPNVRRVLVDTPCRDQHSTLWLTQDAAEEFLEQRELEESVDYDSLTGAQQQLLETHAAGANALLRNVDGAFLEMVSGFLKAAAQG